MNRIHRIGGIAVAAVLVVVACSPSGSLDDSADTTADSTVDSLSGSTSTATVGEPTTTEGIAEASREACGHASGESVAWEAGVTANARILQQQTANQAGVEVVVYPRPEYSGRPWSQWGQGIVLDDGRFLSAIGDHLGADGNSYLYEYDPSTGTLTRFADALTVVGHEPGEWGFGKIHAAMVEGPCGDVYVSTYWGTRRGLNFTDGYQGDVLLRLDPTNRTIENLGVILPEHGVASLASWPEGGLLYAEAADPFGQKTGSFVVLDARTGDMIFQDDDPSHGGYRSVAVDAQGRAYITWDGDGLARYDPATNTLETLGASMPGSILRWATPPDDSDIVYAVSRDPAVFFTLDPQGNTAELAPAQGYTTAMGLAPDGETFYYIPDAHGGAWNHGTSLIAVDTETGDESVVVKLNPLVEAGA
ncbi:MAG: hypothetical protein ABFR53_06470, partial [Actinomycetota bacterium]